VERATPLQVTRVESATGWWEFARGEVDRRLSGVVTGLCGYRERASGALQRRMPASSRVPLILSFGEQLEVLDMADGEGAGCSYESFVAGFHPGYAVTRYEGAQFGLQIDLTPLGAYRVFGIPGAALTSRVLHLEDVAPTLARSLPDRLASLPTWEQRFAAVEGLLTSLVDRGPEPDPLVRWMWGQLQASGGHVRIADLVEESGRSHRHVTSRFRDQIGLTPKAAAGVIRFERAATALAPGDMALAEVAARCGYADQSHLTREFVRLAGCTPAAFADPTAASLSGTS
jgi:AraC-like DNA-binding protein